MEEAWNSFVFCEIQVQYTHNYHSALSREHVIKTSHFKELFRESFGEEHVRL